MKNNIGLLLTKRALLNGNREAYVDSRTGVRLNFSELNDRCNQLAQGLLKQGVKQGDRVALMLMNSSEFIEAYFAIAKIGGVVVPLNWRLVADELEFILKNSGASVLIFGEDFDDVVAELHGHGDNTDIATWIQVGTSGSHFSLDYETLLGAESAEEPEVSACDDDLLFIMYTSGTTGLPKGVVATHTSIMWALFTFTGTGDLRDADRYLTALPMFHIGALLPVTLNIYKGVTSIVMREFDPLRAWKLIAEEKITGGLLVPAMLNFMMQVPNLKSFDRSSVRSIHSGASPLPVNLIRQFSDIGIEIHQVYGLSLIHI